MLPLDDHYPPIVDLTLYDNHYVRVIFLGTMFGLSRETKVNPKCRFSTSVTITIDQLRGERKSQGRDVTLRPRLHLRLRQKVSLGETPPKLHLSVTP